MYHSSVDNSLDMIDAEILVFMIGKVDVDRCVVEDLQEAYYEGVLHECIIERKAKTQRLQLFRVFPKRNRSFINLLEATDALFFFLVLINNPWLGSLAMPSRELPIRVQNVHFEVFLYVLINLIPFYLSIVVLRKLNVEGALLLKVVARIMWNT